jgi:hypothetical protein
MSYDEQDIERGLQGIALFSGNARAAARELKKLGHPIPEATLRGWKRRMPERYERVRQTVQDRIWAEIADEWRSLVRQSIKVASNTVAKAEVATAEGNSKDAKAWLSAGRDAGVLAGIGDDKSSRADGRPTEIHATTADQAEEIERKLKAMGVLVVEGEAEELPPRELSPGPD